MTEPREPGPSSSELVFLDPGAHFEIRALAPGLHDTAARILIDHPGIEDVRAATQFLETTVSTPKAAVFGAHLEGELIAVYALTRDGMANDLATIVVHPAHRQRGVGRRLLQDALRRSGKRPLVAQIPEAILPFFKACGFKMVGRRAQPSGEIHFRVGWHAPGAHFKGGTTAALKHLPLDRTGDSKQAIQRGREHDR